MVISITPLRHTSAPPPNKGNGHGNQVYLKYRRHKKRPGDLPAQTIEGVNVNYKDRSKLRILQYGTLFRPFYGHMTIRGLTFSFYMAAHNAKRLAFFDTSFSQNYSLIFPLLRNILLVNTKSSSNVLNCFDEGLKSAL